MVSGYWSGVVCAFSISTPITRASSAVNSIIPRSVSNRAGEGEVRVHQANKSADVLRLVMAVVLKVAERMDVITAATFSTGRDATGLGIGFTTALGTFCTGFGGAAAAAFGFFAGGVGTGVVT